MSALPTLPGHTRGIVGKEQDEHGRDVYLIQCEDCHEIERPRMLVMMQTVFHHNGVTPGTQVPRLCPSCMAARFPNCPCSTCDEHVHGH